MTGSGGAAAGGGGGLFCGTAGAAAMALPVIDTATQAQTGFENGTVAPYHICTTQNPNYGQVATVNGRMAAKFHWTQVGYDGTRLDRGAEACSNLGFTKDGWYGFQFYMPSPGFPTDKTLGIAQIFANGGCSSWAAMLQARNDELWFDHRGNCASPPQYDVRLATNIPRNTWNSVIIHFTASHLNAGGVEIWFGPATCSQAAPTYSKTGINFGFGAWTGDDLTADPTNLIGLKFGMYNFDDGNYTAGETRDIYYDNVIQLVGNPADAWTRVNPNNR